MAEEFSACDNNDSITMAKKGLVYEYSASDKNDSMTIRPNYHRHLNDGITEDSCDKNDVIEWYNY